MKSDTLKEVREALVKFLGQTKISGINVWNVSGMIDAEKALAKLDAFIEAQGWQPIETAPRDGTVILAFFPIGKGKRLYGNTKMVNFDHQSWRIYPGQSVIKSHPTHWMPLPKPPTQGDNDDE